MDNDLRTHLHIPSSRLDEINALLLDPNSRVINDFLAVVEKYGTVEEINRKAQEARQLPRAHLPKVDAHTCPSIGRVLPASSRSNHAAIATRFTLPSGSAGAPRSMAA